jgi:hypothetical protein
MQIEMPFAYKVRATTSRWKNPKDVVQVGFVAWDVPEIASRDAPLAIEWEHVVPAPQALNREETYRREVRVVGEEFYTPFGTTGNHANFAKKFDAAVLPRHRDNHYNRSINHIFDLWPYADTDLRMKALEEWFSYGVFCSELDNKNDVRIVLSEEEKERKLAEAICSRFLLIDGDVFIRVNEPKIAYTAWQLPHPGAGVSMTFHPEDLGPSGERDPWDSPARHLIFRADDYHSLEKHSIAKRVRIDRNEVRDLVVHMPQVLGFDASRELSYRTAAFALNAVEDGLGHVGRKATNAWYDVKDALARFREDQQANMLDEIISQAIPVILEGMRAAGHGGTAELEECLELWSSSEIALDVGVEVARSLPRL